MKEKPLHDLSSPSLPAAKPCGGNSGMSIHQPSHIRHGCLLVIIIPYIVSIIKQRTLHMCNPNIGGLFFKLVSLAIQQPTNQPIMSSTVATHHPGGCNDNSNPQLQRADTIGPQLGIKQPGKHHVSGRWVKRHSHQLMSNSVCHRHW